MSAKHRTIAAIGEHELVRDLALAGVRVYEADGPAATIAAWDGLEADVGLVILTSAARAALEAAGRRPDGEQLWVVLPR